MSMDYYIVTGYALYIPDPSLLKLTDQQLETLIDEEEWHQPYNLDALGICIIPEFNTDKSIFDDTEGIGIPLLKHDSILTPPYTSKEEILNELEKYKPILPDHFDILHHIVYLEYVLYG